MLPSAAAAHVLTVLLAAQHGAGFDGRVQASIVPPIQPGAQGELSVTILDTPTPDVPVSVRLSARRVVLPDSRLGARDVVDPLAQQPRIRARFFAPAAPGRYEVEGLVEYLTCDAQHCRPHRRRVVWVVEVVEPTPTE